MALSILVALLWSIACFRAVFSAIDKVYFKNAPSLLNALTCAGGIFASLATLGMVVAGGAWFILDIVELLTFESYLSQSKGSITLMTLYALLKATACGIMAGLGALSGKESALTATLIILTLGCFPVFIFVPLFCGI